MKGAVLSKLNNDARKIYIEEQRENKRMLEINRAMGNPNFQNFSNSGDYDREDEGEEGDEGEGEVMKTFSFNK